MSRRLLLLLLLLLKSRINRVCRSPLNVAHLHRVPQLVVQLLRLQQLPALFLVRLGEVLIMLPCLVVFRRQATHLALQCFNLRIGLADRLLEAAAERRVLFRQRLVEVLLVVYVLRRLVRPEAERAPGTLHDDAGRQPAEDARLVRLGRLEVRDDGVVGAAELGIAGWAWDAVLSVLTREAEAVGALQAENMAALASISVCGRSNRLRIAYLHVVTSARSPSSARHFRLLQVSGRSIMPYAFVCDSVLDNRWLLMRLHCHARGSSWQPVESHLLCTSTSSRHALLRSCTNFNNRLVMLAKRTLCSQYLAAAFNTVKNTGIIYRDVLFGYNLDHLLGHHTSKGS